MGITSQEGGNRIDVHIDNQPRADWHTTDHYDKGKTLWGNTGIDGAKNFSSVVGVNSDPTVQDMMKIVQNL